jgi:hypothetical protein
LNLKCDFLVSKLAFKCNLYRYSEESESESEDEDDGMHHLDSEVGGCTS